MKVGARDTPQGIGIQVHKWGSTQQLNNKV